MTPQLKKLMLQLALDNPGLKPEIFSIVSPQQNQITQIKIEPEVESAPLHKIIDYALTQKIRTQNDESEFPAFEGFDPDMTKPNLMLESPSGKIKIFLYETGRGEKSRKIKGVLVSELHSPLIFQMEINCPDFFGKRVAGGKIGKIPGIT